MVRDRLAPLKMSASEDGALVRVLQGFLDDWRSLTLAEGKAIQTENWERLKQLQIQKVALQKSIEDSERSLFQSSSLTELQKSEERIRIKEIVNELLALEQKNQDVLTKRMAETDVELKDSNRTISSLRYIQKAYGKGGRSFWQAYS